jgi:hypothetical protein
MILSVLYSSLRVKEEFVLVVFKNGAHRRILTREEQIFAKQGVKVWTGLIWLRIGTSGGLL